MILAEVQLVFVVKLTDESLTLYDAGKMSASAALTRR